MTSTKITGLTGHNVSALDEARRLAMTPLLVKLTPTTAEWAGLTPAQAITWLDGAMAKMPPKGHPRHSLHAVRRKLAKLVPAHQPLKEEL